MRITAAMWLLLAVPVQWKPGREEGGGTARGAAARLLLGEDGERVTLFTPLVVRS